MTQRTSRRAARIAAVLLFVALLAGARAVQRAHQLRPREIPVLMYHNVLDGDGLTVWQVSADEFAWQMDQLDEAGYTPVLPGDVERASRGWGWLPEKPVVITFDDGYEGVKTFAEPVLAKHGFKAICYAIVDRLGGEGEERTSFDSGPLMSTNEVAAMAARGTVAIGSHSLTHRANPRLLADEIRRSRYRLKELTGIRTKDYCYPFGLHGYDYMYNALRESKFRTALICDDRMFRYGVETNLLAIPRLSVYGGIHSVGFGAADPVAGTLAITNGGLPIPLKIVARREDDGRTWESDVRWVGGRHEPVWEVPPEILSPPWRIEARDKAGLFRYFPRAE